MRRALLALSGCAGLTPVRPSVLGAIAPADPSQLAGGGLVGDGAASLISNNAGALVSDNAASLNGSVSAPAALIGSSPLVSDSSSALVGDGASSYDLASLLGRSVQTIATVPLQRALVYLSDTRERLYLDPRTGSTITTTTDANGTFTFPKAPATDSLVVNAVLSGNRRMVGFSITKAGSNSVTISLASTLVTEFLRSRALAAGGDRTLGSYDPNFQAIPQLVTQTQAGLDAGKLSIPDLTVGKIPDMDRHYLVEFATRLPALLGAWQKLLGYPLTVIQTIAGSSSGYSGDGGPASKALMAGPTGMCRVSDGTIYVADSSNNVIRKIAPDGTISTVVGGGTPGQASASGSIGAVIGDGGPATQAILMQPRGVLALDDLNPLLKGALLVSEFAGDRIRLVLPNGTIQTISQGTYSPGGPDGCLDGSCGPRPNIHLPTQMIIGPKDRTNPSGPDKAIYIADTGNATIRTLDLNPLNPQASYMGHIAGQFLDKGQDPASPDGTPGTSAYLAEPSALCFGADGTLYFTEFLRNRISKLTPDGRYYRVAGTGATANSGDGGPALEAAVGFPAGLACDPVNNRLYVGSWQQPRIRMIDLNSGLISTLAGAGASADDGLASESGLTDLNGMALEPSGNLLFVETQTARLRRLWLNPGQ